MEIFVKLFSGTVRPRRLKLGTHVNSGWMYPVDRNQGATLIIPQQKVVLVGYIVFSISVIPSFCDSVNI